MWGKFLEPKGNFQNDLKSFLRLHSFLYSLVWTQIWHDGNSSLYQKHQLHGSWIIWPNVIKLTVLPPFLVGSVCVFQEMNWSSYQHKISQYYLASEGQYWYYHRKHSSPYWKMSWLKIPKKIIFLLGLWSLTFICSITTVL